MADTRNYISQIRLPSDNTTYFFKDLGARDLIAELQSGALTFHKSTSAADTPYGITWSDGSTVITGTLTAANATKSWIYLVPSQQTSTDDIKSEYIVTNDGTEQSPNYVWEKLGDTDINIDSLGDLAYHDNVVLDKGAGDNVLGESTTFTNSSSEVSFTGGNTDSFVKSYPGATSKMETTTITGVAGEDTITATNTVLGTATTASKVVTETKTATNTVFGTATKASKATAGTAKTVAKVAPSATSVSYIGDDSTASIIATATVSGEVLTFGSVSVKQDSVTGTDGTESITPYTFTDVTVPVISSNDSVSVASVKTNTDVTVPVISSNTAVTKTFATKGTDKTVATGSLKANDAVGATIMTGLGTPTTADAITDIGTATAGAQTITVGTNDRIKVAKYDDLGVSVTDN